MKMRKILLTSIVVLLAVCMVLSISYAYYMITPGKQTSVSSSATIPKCASISVLETTTILLEGDYAIPIQEDRLFSSSQIEQNHYKYGFTITNGCGNTNASVTLAFAPTENNTMPLEAIKYLLVPDVGALSSTNAKFLYDNNKVKLSNSIISDVTTNLNNIASASEEENEVVLDGYGYELGTVNVSSSSTYRLFMWIDYDEGGLEDMVTMGKTLEGVIVLTNYSSLS